MKNWNLKIEWSLSLIVQFTRLFSLRVLGSSVVWSSGVLLLIVEQSEKSLSHREKGWTHPTFSAGCTVADWGWVGLTEPLRTFKNWGAKPGLAQPALRSGRAKGGLAEAGWGRVGNPESVRALKNWGVEPGLSQPALRPGRAVEGWA
jgi:hypothetical protein